MNKEKLIEILRISLPSRRLLEVVSIGAVKVGDELIILKQRPDYEVIEEDMITYNERHEITHGYRELIAKSVIFDNSLFYIRGRLAIEAYKLSKNSTEEKWEYYEELVKTSNTHTDSVFSYMDKYGLDDKARVVLQAKVDVLQGLLDKN